MQTQFNGTNCMFLISTVTLELWPIFYMISSHIHFRTLVLKDNLLCMVFQTRSKREWKVEDSMVSWLNKNNGFSP